MNAKIIEIFRSIQGEGKYTGVNQVFVRFFECNMHCVWCDTPHSIGDTTRRYQEMSLDEIMQKIENLASQIHSVTLTGGEPLLQTGFISKMLPKLKQMKLPVHLETNGTLPEELEKIIQNIDVVAMDLKLPSSTQCRSYWDEHRQFLEIAKQTEVFVKTVVSVNTSDEDIHQSVEVVRDIDPEIFFILQPNTFDLGSGIMNKCQSFEQYCSKYLRNVRILPQIHKILKVR